MTRRRGELTPEEAALWARVAADVRPLTGRRRPALTAEAIRAPAPRPSAIEPPRPKSPAPRAAPPPAAAATLDAGWDRRIASGRHTPDRTIDLHGLSRDAAHDRLRHAIPEASVAGARLLLVITGRSGPAPAIDTMQGLRPRGVIRASLMHWLDAADLRPFIAAVRPAHPRHGGRGAVYVVLRRRR